MTFEHQEAHVVCNHCGSVFRRPPLALEDGASGFHLLCPFCGFNPTVPCIEKGGWHEASQELRSQKGVH